LNKTAELEFSSVTISFFVHATEDENLLLSVVAQSLRIDKEGIVTEILEGHYGNRLVSVHAHIIGNLAQFVSIALISKLDRLSKDLLVSMIDKYLDEHEALYLRLDRQRMPEQLSLTDDEPIRIKLKPKSRARDREGMTKKYIELIKS
jgi:RNA binding exosome subunit